MLIPVKKTFMITTVVFFTASAISAVQPVESEPDETLLVTATRSATSLWNSPATLQIVDQQKLDSSTSTSLADDLMDIPGVEVTDNALAGRKLIRLRGEAASRVLILIDGQEVTYQRAGEGYGAGLLIDESALERIEVVKGPLSVLYGSQAIGGVVNFITKKGGDKPLIGRVKAVYNSASAGWEESASVWGSLGNLDYRLNGGYSDQGDRSTPDGRLAGTSFRNNGQGLWLGYNLDRHQFGLSLERHKLSTQTGIDDPSFEQFKVSIPALERQKTGLFYDYLADKAWLKKVHFDAYSQSIERQFENTLTVNTPTRSAAIGHLRVANQTVTHDKQTTLGMTFQSDFSLPGDNQLVLGAQYQRDKVRQSSRSATQSSSSRGFPAAVNYTKASQGNSHSAQSNWSVFAQNEWQLAEEWRWTLGGRYYWLTSTLNDSSTLMTHSQSGSSHSSLQTASSQDRALVTSTSLRYSGFDHTELRLGLGQGYVFPTLGQLFMETSAGGGISYGNPALKSEHSNNLELGARYNHNMWLLDGAVYSSAAKDYIASLPCSGQPVCHGNSTSSRSGFYYYDNVNRARTYGLELTAEYNGWAFSPYLSGNLIRRQFQGETVKTWNTGEPILNGRVGLRQTTLLNDLTLSSDLFIRAAAAAKNDVRGNEIRSPGWATLNMAFTAEFGLDDQYQVNAALNNLTNKRYQTAHESLQAAGFNAAVGLLWKF